MNSKCLTVSNIEVTGKKILVMGAFDVDDANNPRADSIRTMVEFLITKKAASIRVIGHCETDFDLASQLRKEYPMVEFDDQVRKDSREKENSQEYAQQLAGDFDIYVNEDFATSHRNYTSYVALPEYMKKTGKEVCVGMRFERELEQLNKVWEIPGNRVLVIGGVKIDDKQRFAEEMKDHFLYVLRGGKLPGVNLRPDGLDISDETIQDYKNKISEAEVILAAGVMGKYEDANASKGTKEILGAIADSKAYKVAGGGDIEMAISTYGLSHKFDWISVGGGAMLEYLKSGTLVGINAICQ